MTFKKFIIVTSVPFNNRDYKRLGVDTFINLGLPIEILDISVFSKSRAPDAIEHKFNNISIVVPSSDQEIISYLKNNRDALYIDFADLHHPFYAEARKHFASMNLDILLTLVNDVPGMEVMRYATADGYHPKYIVFGGAYSFLRIPSYDPKTKLILAHTLDYDNYLEFSEHNQSINVENQCVFLDAYYPFHPDHHELKTGFIDPDKYYGSLRNLFSLVEKCLDMPVVIATHPRSQYHKHPDYYGGRTLIDGDTIGSVARSRVVISHASTALNYAVLFNKPIFLVTTDDVERTPSMKFHFARLEEELKLSTVNLDQPIKNKIELAVSNLHYQLYREKFIKIKGSPELPFWKLVIDAL